MHAIDDRMFVPSGIVRVQSHLRHQSQERQRGTEFGTYCDDVPSADPRVQMFGKFIDRTLKESRSRGMSTEEIEERTGLARSTIYRWRRAEIESPQRRQVIAFCEGLGIPVTTAAQILGWDGGPQPTEPEPSVDPDLRAVMRKLNDPNVPSAAKTTIREMLRYLAREE